MFGNWLEAAIVVFILVGLGVTIWKGGASNPVGTGGLDRRVSRMDGEIKQALTGLADLKSYAEQVDQRSAKKEDIERLEIQLAGQETKINEVLRGVAHVNQAAAGREVQIEHIRRQVDRLYDHIVQKGMR